MWWSNLPAGHLKSSREWRISWVPRCAPWARSWVSEKIIRRHSRRQSVPWRQGDMAWAGSRSWRRSRKNSFYGCWSHLPASGILPCMRHWKRAPPWKRFTKSHMLKNGLSNRWKSWPGRNLGFWRIRAGFPPTRSWSGRKRTVFRTSIWACCWRFPSRRSVNTALGWGWRKPGKGFMSAVRRTALITIPHTMLRIGIPSEAISPR